MRNTWLTMHSDVMEGLIQRAHAGEDPDLLMVEFYANCETEVIDGPGA